MDRRPLRIWLAEREPESLVVTQSAQPDDGYEHVICLTEQERDEIVAELERLAAMDAEW